MPAPQPAKLQVLSQEFGFGDGSIASLYLLQDANDLVSGVRVVTPAGHVTRVAAYVTPPSGKAGRTADRWFPGNVDATTNPAPAPAPAGGSDETVNLPSTLPSSWDYSITFGGR